MNGRRILDAAAIYKASRGVASKYAALRRQQWENYSKTSSLAKAVKNQADRVTLTVKAASALSERFNSTGPTYSTQAPTKGNSASETSIPSRESVQETDRIPEKRQGLEQDHFYQRSKGNSTAEPLPEGELGVKQEKAKRYPLPDSSIPPETADVDVSQQQEIFSDVSRTEPPESPLPYDEAGHDGVLKPTSSGRTSIPDLAKVSEQSQSGRTRKLQRTAEKQIPSESAEPPPLTSRRESRGQDVFHSPSSENRQSFSSLPRVKLPKSTEDRQQGESPSEINPDVFYSSVTKDQKPSVPESQALPEQEQISDDMYSEIFHSPKVARILGAKSKLANSQKDSDLHVQQYAALEQTKALQDRDQESFCKRPIAQGNSQPKACPDPSEEPESSRNADEDEIHRLAADMAKDSDSGTSVPASVSFLEILRVLHQLIN